MIVLSSDQTLELEFRTLLDFEGVALYHARIPNEMENNRRDTCPNGGRTADYSIFTTCFI
ncbi:MAG: hypothetical protein CM1200mP30_17710 [Pseudomonadota bacterium]|nr:MAG: hypothetical protein CM1200mP30_17710 [Pseudomonadota bacterium]